MAFPTAVNSQITDAVTQSNVKVVGEAPATSLGLAYQTISQATGIAAQNATTHQQAANQISQALVTRCVESLLGPARK